MRCLAFVIIQTFSLFTSVILGQFSASKLFDLHPKLNEISGAIVYKNHIWGMNDGGNSAKLFSFQIHSNTITDSTTFSNVQNEDWEAISATDSLIYIADVGNNNGTRKYLYLYCFPKTELGKKNVSAKKIVFYYPEHTQFFSNPLSNYDCEAIVAYNQHILVFTKSKADGKCRTYKVNLDKDTSAAELIDSSSNNTWVTDACLHNQKIYFCAYTYFGFFTTSLGDAILFPSGKYEVLPKLANTPFSSSQQIETVFWLEDTMYICSEANGNKAACIYRITRITNSVQKKSTKKVHLLIHKKDSNILEISNSDSEIKNIEIYDINSKKIIDQKKYANNSKMQVLDISGLKCGYYFIIVELSNGKVGRRKIYKQ